MITAQGPVPGCGTVEAGGQRPVVRRFLRGAGARSATDEGSGTVLVLGLVGVLVILTLALAVAVLGHVLRAGAQVAADLAALAGAGSIAVPRGVVLDGAAIRAVDPCGRAALVAERNGAELTGCGVLPQGVVQVEVRVRHGATAAVATARAGPASAR